MAAHARLQNGFAEDEKYHNLMRCLKSVYAIYANKGSSQSMHPRSLVNAFIIHRRLV